MKLWNNVEIEFEGSFIPSKRTIISATKATFLFPFVYTLVTLFPALYFHGKDAFQGLKIFTPGAYFLYYLSKVWIPDWLVSVQVFISQNSYVYSVKGESALDFLLFLLCCFLSFYLVAHIRDDKKGHLEQVHIPATDIFLRMLLYIGVFIVAHFSLITWLTAGRFQDGTWFSYGSNVMLWLLPEFSWLWSHSVDFRPYTFLYLTSLLGGGLFLILGLMRVDVTMKKGRRRYRKRIQPALDHKRGAIQAEYPDYIKIAQKKFPKARLHFGLGPDRKRIPWPSQAPCAHTFVLGSPDGGKTFSLINPLIHQARQLPNDKTIIFDYKKDFTEALAGEEKVTILCPVDARSAHWNPALDVRRVQDVDIIAHAAIPEKDGAGNKDFFDNTCRSVFKSVLANLFNLEKLSWAEVENVLAGGQENVFRFLQQFASSRKTAALVDPDSKSGSGQDILSTVTEKTPWLTELARAWPGGDFSLREWLAAPGSATLIVKYDPEHKTLTGTLSSMVAAFLIQILAGQPDQNERKYWFFLDEFSNLPKISNIGEGLAALRSKGAAFVLTCQDSGQLVRRYGKGAPEIVGCTSSQAFFRQGSGESAEFASKALGDAEVKRTSQSLSSKISKDLLDGDSSQNHSDSADLRTSKVVLPGELLSLEQGEAFVKLRGLPVTKFKYCGLGLKKKYPGAIPAPWLDEREKPLEVAAPAAPEEEETEAATAATVGEDPAAPERVEADAAAAATDEKDELLDELDNVLRP